MPVPDGLFDWLSPQAPRLAPDAPGGDAGCPVLTRLAAYVADRGLAAVCRHTLRDRVGTPLDLTFLAGHPGLSSPDPAVTAAAAAVDPWPAGSGVPPVVLPAYPSPDESGAVELPLPPALVATTGLYRLSLVVRDAAGRPVRTDRAVLSVEPTPWSLAAGGTGAAASDPCPTPTVRELRQRLVDTGPADNLRLDDVEFSADQLLLALERPVAYWNEQPPVGADKFTVRTFPFRDQWLDAAVGYLHQEAATHYRRNSLAAQVGGVARDSLDREQAYRAEADRLLGQYRQFVQTARTARSRARAWGGLGSGYGHRWGW